MLHYFPQLPKGRTGQDCPGGIGSFPSGLGGISGVLFAVKSRAIFQ